MTRYKNLYSKDSNICSNTICYYSLKGRKMLNFNVTERTLYFYWWDFIEVGLNGALFEKNLLKLFKDNYLNLKEYNYKVEAVKALYIGWDKKEIGTY